MLRRPTYNGNWPPNYNATYDHAHKLAIERLTYSRDICTWNIQQVQSSAIPGTGSDDAIAWAALSQGRSLAPAALKKLRASLKHHLRDPNNLAKIEAQVRNNFPKSRWAELGVRKHYITPTAREGTGKRRGLPTKHARHYATRDKEELHAAAAPALRAQQAREDALFNAILVLAAAGIASVAQLIAGWLDPRGDIPYRTKGQAARLAQEWAKWRDYYSDEIAEWHDWLRDVRRQGYNIRKPISVRMQWPPYPLPRVLNLRNIR